MNLTLWRSKLTCCRKPFRYVGVLIWDPYDREMERVTTHGVSLSAHFDRFGYSARSYSVHSCDDVLILLTSIPDVKSYDDESPSHSGVSTPRHSSISEKNE